MDIFSLSSEADEQMQSPESNTSAETLLVCTTDSFCCRSDGPGTLALGSCSTHGLSTGLGKEVSF